VLLYGSWSFDTVPAGGGASPFSGFLFCFFFFFFCVFFCSALCWMGYTVVSGGGKRCLAWSFFHGGNWFLFVAFTPWVSFPFQLSLLSSSLSGFSGQCGSTVGLVSPPSRFGLNLESSTDFRGHFPPLISTLGPPCSLRIAPGSFCDPKVLPFTTLLSLLGMWVWFAVEFGLIWSYYYPLLLVISPP